MNTVDLSRLKELPFPQQRELIARSVGQVDTAVRLLRGVSLLADHEPLCLTVLGLAQAELLDTPEVSRTLNERVSCIKVTHL